MRAKNKATGKIVELYFMQGDTRREYCYASDHKQKEYYLPEAKTSNYELL